MLEHRFICSVPLQFLCRVNEALISENRDIGEKFNKAKAEIGVFPTYFYDSQVGRDAQRVLRGWRTLWKIVKNKEVFLFCLLLFRMKFDVSPKMRETLQKREKSIALFDAAAALYPYLTTSIPSEEQKTQFREAVLHLRDCWVAFSRTDTMIPKVHSLMHLVTLNSLMHLVTSTRSSTDSTRNMPTCTTAKRK